MAPAKKASSNKAPAKKTLFCFCHWGGENVVRADGNVSYVGGVTDQVIVESNMKYDAFVKAVFDRLRIEPSGKILQYSVKFDRLQLICLQDQDGLDKLIQFNDDFAHVYVSKCEFEPVAALVMDSTRGSTTEIEALQNQQPEERQNSEGRLVDETTLLTEGESATLPVTKSGNDVTQSASVKWGEVLLGEGQAFETAEALRRAVFKYAIAKKFTYKFLDNSPKYMRVKCTVDGCPWKVTAGLEPISKQISIKRFIECHSHPPADMTNFKPKVKSKWLGEIVQGEILSSPGSVPREVCVDAERNFNITLTYKQAWRAKKKFKEASDGKVEDSYKLIPWLCNRLSEAMPGTIATWSCNADDRFKQLFVSYRCLIHGFHAGCRPLIFIDFEHMSGPYRSTLLTAYTLDADNGVYPLAYSVISSLNEESCLFFLENLKLIVRDREVVIVSNTNPLIQSAVDTIFGEGSHAYCFHCVQEDFSKFIDSNRAFNVHGRGKEIALDYINEIAHARTIEMYNEALAKMYRFRKELHDWLIAHKPEHWSNALFLKPRWDWLSSNVADSFIALIGEEQVLQIPQMMEAYRTKLSQVLQNKQNEIGRWNLPVGPQTENKILENQKCGNNLVVIAQSNFEVELKESHGVEGVVNLKLGTCTCLEWQMTGIPCRHACRAIALANMDVYQCVSDWYKREVQEHIYADVMLDVPKIDIPNPDEIDTADVQVAANGATAGKNVLSPFLRPSKRRPGRPRKEPVDPQVRENKRMRCSLCGYIGHNRKKCKKSLLVSHYSGPLDVWSPD